MNQKTLTGIAFWGGCLLVIIVASYFTIKYFSIDHGLEKIDLNEKEALRFAANLYFTKLERIGQISLALIGALWIFLVDKDRTLRLKTFHQIGLFTITNIFLLGSFVFYLFGNDFLISLIFFHSTIDLDAPIVKFWSDLQIWFFLSGLVYLVTTILLSKK